MKYYNIGILLTRNCQEKCYYCFNYNGKKEETEVDLEYFKWILSKYSDLDLTVELSGGEPGLVRNILDVIEYLENSSFVKRWSILSNGLFRKKYGTLSDKYKKIYYIGEHLCLDIVDRNILYFDKEINFYNMEKNAVGIIILTERTTDSLIKNFDYFLGEGFFSNNLVLKTLTPKIQDVSEELRKKYDIFFNHYFNNETNLINPESLKTNTVGYTYFIRHFDKNQKEIEYCSSNSKYQFIDLDNKKLGMCSMQVEYCDKVDITEENIKKSINGELFKCNWWCIEKCNKPERGNILISRNKKERPWNFMIKEKSPSFSIKNNAYVKPEWFPITNVNETQLTKELEKTISEYIGVSDCVAICNGTTSIYLGMIGLGLKPGDKIILPSYSYPALHQSANMIGLETIICDIKKSTLCLDPDKVLNILDSVDGIKAIGIIEHLGRIDEDTLRIREICNERNIFMIEDSAQSFAHEYKGHKGGTIGDFGIFSFSGNKLLKAGRGGCLVTNNSDLANKVRDIRSNNGNFELSVILSGIVLNQINRLDEILEVRKKYCQLYKKYGVEFIQVPNDNYVGEHNIAGLHQNLNKFVDFCKNFNIQVRYKFYKSYLENSVATEIFSKYVELPYFGEFSEKEIQTVSNIYRMTSK